MKRLVKRFMKRFFCVAALLFLISCGASPTEPSKASVSGAWSGTFASANFATVAMTMQVTQSGTSITGSWQVPINDWNGTVSGTNTDGQFTGTMTLSSPNALGLGPRCTGNASVTGTTAAQAIHWNSSAFTGSCTGEPRAVTITLQK